MEDKYYAAEDCEFPAEAELGDVWYCPGCARKWEYDLLYLGEGEGIYEVWFTTEIG